VGAGAVTALKVGRHLRVKEKIELAVKPYQLGDIVEYEWPASAHTEQDVPWKLVVHNKAYGTYGTIFGGIANLPGNPGSIIVTFQEKEYEIPPGYWLAMFRPISYCGFLDLKGLVRFLATGSYVIDLYGGHRDTEWVVDDYIRVTTGVSPPPVEEGRVYGVVLGLLDKPVAGVTLEIDGKLAISGPGGSFDFGAVPYGTYTLKAYHWLYKYYEAPATVDAPEVKLTVKLSVKPEIIAGIIALGALSILGMVEVVRE